MAAAVLVAVLVPDRWGVLAAFILMLAGVGLRRWNIRQDGKSFTIFADGTWQAPGCDAPTRLRPSSVDLGGILWLHGCGDDGQRLALMVLPDACELPQARRWLRVWFHNVAQSTEPDKPETI